MGRPRFCNSCNQGIGKLEDSPDLLRRAAAYIEVHSDKPDGNHFLPF